MAQQDTREKARQILVVAADDSVRDLMDFLLRRAGFDVVMADDGCAALETLRKAVPDVVITGCRMPRMNGVDLTQHIRSDAQTAHIPIMAMSADADSPLSDVAQMFMKAGANVVLGVPVEPKCLIECIEELTKINPAEDKQESSSLFVRPHPNRF